MSSPSETRDTFARTFSGFPESAWQELAAEMQSEAGSESAAVTKQRHRGRLSWLAIVTVCTAFGVLLVPAFSWAKYVLVDRGDYVQFQDFWAPFAGESQRLTVAIPNTVINDPATNRPLVSNRLGTGDALALAHLYRCFASQGLSPDFIKILPVDQANKSGVTVDGPVCVIGGPRTSQFAFEKFCQLLQVSQPGNVEALKRGFRFDVRSGHENALVRVVKPNARGELPPLGITDVETGETCAVDLQADGGFLDAALILRGDVDGSPVLVVAGYEQHATMMAMQALTQPGEVVTALNRAYQAEGLAQLVVRADGQRGIVEIYDFERAENPKSGT